MLQAATARRTQRGHTFISQVGSLFSNCSQIDKLNQTHDEFTCFPFVWPWTSLLTVRLLIKIHGYPPRWFPEETIYVTGGRNRDACLSSLEKFDSPNNNWEFLEGMRSQRTAVGMAALNNHIYCIGGEIDFILYLFFSFYRF